MVQIVEDGYEQNTCTETSPACERLRQDREDDNGRVKIIKVWKQGSEQEMPAAQPAVGK